METAVSPKVQPNYLRLDEAINDQDYALNRLADVIDRIKGASVDPQKVPEAPYAEPSLCGLLNTGAERIGANSARLDDLTSTLRDLLL